MTDTDKDRIAALEREVAALKEAGKPPAPFNPGDWQRYDPTANMRMPPSVVREMANAVPTGMIQDLVRHGTVQSPSQAGTSGQVTSVRGPSGIGTGWAREIPLSPPPGVAQADRLMDHQDKLDKAELAQRLGALKR
jgi:hypothetical protein